MRRRYCLLSRGRVFSLNKMANINPVFNVSGAKKYGLIISKKKVGSGASVSRPSAFDDSDEEEKPKLSGPIPLLSSAQNSKLKKQAQIQISKALADDPSVYEYDNVYDEMKEVVDKKAVLAKEKDKSAKKPKYMIQLMKAAEVRKKENDRRDQRMVQKELEAETEDFGDKEQFVTGAYKQKLEEQKADDEKEKLQTALEAKQDVTKQDNMNNFYRHMLDQSAGEVKTEPDDEMEIKQEPIDDKVILTPVSKTEPAEDTVPDRKFETQNTRPEYEKSLGRNYRKSRTSADNNDDDDDNDKNSKLESRSEKNHRDEKSEEMEHRHKYRDEDSRHKKDLHAKSRSGNRDIHDDPRERKDKSDQNRKRKSTDQENSEYYDQGRKHESSPKRKRSRSRDRDRLNAADSQHESSSRQRYTYSEEKKDRDQTLDKDHRRKDKPRPERRDDKSSPERRNEKPRPERRDDKLSPERRNEKPRQERRDDKLSPETTKSNSPSFYQDKQNSDIPVTAKTDLQNKSSETSKLDKMAAAKMRWQQRQTDKIQ